MKKLLILLFVLPITCFVIWGGMNYSGFCWTETRWLSDQERIDIAIEKVIYRTKVYIADGVDGSKIYKVVPYKSMEDFKKQNPDCCKVDYGYITRYIPFSDIVFGNVSIWMPEIMGKYVYFYADKKYQKYQAISRGYDGWPLTPMNNCGKILDINNF